MSTKDCTRLAGYPCMLRTRAAFLSVQEEPRLACGRPSKEERDPQKSKQHPRQQTSALCLSWLAVVNESILLRCCYNDKTPFPPSLFDFVILNCRASERAAAVISTLETTNSGGPPFISTPFPSSLTADLRRVWDMGTSFGPS